MCHNFQMDGHTLCALGGNIVTSKCDILTAKVTATKSYMANTPILPVPTGSQVVCRQLVEL